MDRRQFHVAMLAGWGGLAAASSNLFAQRTTNAPATNAPATKALAKSARGQRGVVATVHPLATQAALDAYARGGNAVDAAVAASLMLSVVDIHNSGLGGGGLALIRTPDGKVFAFDGRERAPMAITPEDYLRSGTPDPSLSQTGPLAAATPGLPALLELISSRLGKTNWKDSLLAAAKVAEDGFAIDTPLARTLASSASTLQKFAESKRVLLSQSGDQPPKVGERLVQRDLAQSLKALASDGTAWFYRGEFAKRTEQLMKSNGGKLRADDFEQYYVAERPAIECLYRGKRVVGFPPPSSGGIHIAQMLTMLSKFDVHEIFTTSTARGLHLLAEVMKRAMADRAEWLGDADFAKVPRGLLDEKYLASRANTIELDRSSKIEGFGTPPNAKEDLFAPGKHTTHLTTADDQGFVVALTQTVNTSFGSKMMVPGTGILLNNEMDDFSLAPGVRNAFGLVGSLANAVAPGKRPLSSMSPSIVMDEAGQFQFSCGAAGGPKIITTTLQNLVRVMDLGMSIDQAIAAPRIHHQWSPDVLAVEEALPEPLVAELSSMGHKIERGKTLAVAQGVQRTSDGKLLAASDPRVPSLAAAMP